MPTAFLGATAAAASIGLINAFGNLGGFAGPYLIGYFSVRNGAYSGGLWTMAVALFLSGLLVLMVRGRTGDDPSRGTRDVRSQANRLTER
jgi:nitrate/nitrite transporter NarK